MKMMHFEGTMALAAFEAKVVEIFGVDRLVKRKAREGAILMTLFYAKRKTAGKYGETENHCATWRGDNKTCWIYQFAVNEFEK